MGLLPMWRVVKEAVEGVHGVLVPRAVLQLGGAGWEFAGTYSREWRRVQVALVLVLARVHVHGLRAHGQPARGQPARGQPARGQPARGQLARGHLCGQCAHNNWELSMKILSGAGEGEATNVKEDENVSRGRG